MLNTKSSIFIGGRLPLPTSAETDWTPGLQGCVHYISIDNKDIEVTDDSEFVVSTANIRPCQTEVTSNEEAGSPALKDIF